MSPAPSSSSSTTWHSSLSFSDRLSLIVKITATYRNAHPEIAASDASQYARLLEASIHAESVSLADYQFRCATQIHQLQESARLDKSETNDALVARILGDRPFTAKFGRYSQAAHVENGLFSEIFAARAPETPNPPSFTGRPGAYVALKVTHLSSMLAPHNSEREVRILRKITSPNVIPIWESFHDGGGHLVLVLPFMPFTLERLIREKSLPGTAIKGIVRALFSALAHVHALGIIHRDVKPSNILLESPTGPAVLSDFGIAWSPGDPASEPMGKLITDVGTTCYRSPELLFGYTSYDTSLDMWATGCVVAEIFRGAPLFDGGDVGTDLTLVKSILSTLGAPTEKTWPEINNMPDWGKIEFHQFLPKPWTELVRDAPPEARELVSSLVKYSGRLRLPAAQGLSHNYLAEDVPN